LCSPTRRQAVEIAFSGEKFASSAQKSFCSNHDIPPSIDTRHMGRSTGEYKAGGAEARAFAFYAASRPRQCQYARLGTSTQRRGSIL
jgi:hypothetical protein